MARVVHFELGAGAVRAEFGEYQSDLVVERRLEARGER